MDDNEQFVRARWENVRITSTVVNGYVVVRRLSAEPLKVEKLWVGTLCACSEADAWSAGRAFTEARLESIRLVKEEIALIANVETTTAAFIASIYVAKHIKQDAAKEHPVWQRILAVEQDRLKALRVGLRETGEQQ